MGILKYIDQLPNVERVTELPPHEVDVPSEHADWKSMDSSTHMSLENEHVFEPSCIAFYTSDKYDHTHQYATVSYIDDIIQIQSEIGIKKYATPETDGIVHSSDSINKYTLQEMILSLARTVLSDGYLHGNENITTNDISITYTTDEIYVYVLILW